MQNSIFAVENETARDWNWVDDGVLPYGLAVMRAIWIWALLLLWARLMVPPHAELASIYWVFGLLAVSTLCAQLAAFLFHGVGGVVLVVGGGVVAIALTLYQAFGLTLTADIGAVVVLLPVAAWCWRWGILAGREPLTFDTYARNFLYGIGAMAFVVTMAAVAKKPYGDLAFPILVFFAIGLGTLALSSLRDAQKYETGVAAGLNRYWLGTVAIVIGLLVLVGFLFSGVFEPEWMRQVVGFFGAIYNLIVTVLLAVIYVMSYVVFAIFTFLASFLHKDQNPEKLPPQQPPPNFDDLLKQAQTGGAGIPPLLILLAQIGAVVLIVVVLVLLFRSAFKRFRTTRAEGVNEIHESVFSMDLLKDQLGRLFGRGHTRQGEAQGFVRIQGNDPQATIRRTYQQMQGWATEHGLARTPGQTPSEYLAVLEHAEPQQVTPLRQLTQAYLAARYSPASVSEADANALAQAWQEIVREWNERKPRMTR